MTYTFDYIKKRQGDLSIKSHGESIYTDIQQAVNEPGYKARWFWELLQNAKDSVEDNETVSAKLKLSNDKVEFSHTGNPFNLDEILDLIIQGSSKRERENKTGRFGTGFISTYVLSLKVRIAGLLENGTEFDFELDRDANDTATFLSLQEKCTRAFYDSFISGAESRKKAYNTSFTYNLSLLSQPVANSVIPKLKSILPYVLAFNNKIRDVTIEINGVETTYTKSQSNNSNESFLVTTINVNEKPFCDIVTKGIEDAVVAIRIDYVGDRKIIADYTRDKVDLFFSFPLIGTEVLQLPIVVNSEKWGVKKERDGIFLGSEETTNNKSNKKILANALNALPSFIDWCKQNQVECLFNLIKIRRHSDQVNLDTVWLMSEKIRLIERLEKIELVRCGLANQLIPLKDSYIPDANSMEARKTLWSLYNKFSASNIPLSDELEQWRDVAINFVELAGAGEVRSYLSNVERLCQLISNLESRQNLQSRIKLRDTDFLNELYQFLTEEEHKFFFHFAITLNQYNQLVKITKDIKIDECKDEELKNILVLLRQHARTILVDSSLNLPVNICGTYTKPEVVNKITGLLASKKEGDYADKDSINANGKFLKWLIASGQDELIDTFQIVTTGMDKSNSVFFRKFALGAFKNKKQKLLSPKSTWQSEYPLFAELINEKECLHPIYANLLSGTDLEYLKERSLIHLSPLIKCQDNPTKNLLKQLLKYPAILDDDRDEKDLKIEGKITYFDFAFFVNDEDYIFANNSSSKSSQRILEFVLKEAVHKDASFDRFNTIKIDGKESEIRNSLWVSRLRNSTWVNVNQTNEQGVSKFIGSQPSSFNLAIIFNAVPHLKDLIKDEKVIALLSLLNVSVADLIRNTLSTEKERMDWEKIFTSLLISGLDPLLADKMLQDPNLQILYKKQIEERDLIRRNQELGSKMETGFKDIFSTPEYATLGIQVHRKPWGSDYIITPESSDLVNDFREEELFEIGGWYIELKATGRDYASMTPLQAKRAVENKNNYALIVLPLDRAELSVENILVKAKLITNIGTMLEPKYNEALEADLIQNHLATPGQFVEVHVEKSQIRYRIKSSLWQNGMSINEFTRTVLIQKRPVNSI